MDTSTFFAISVAVSLLGGLTIGVLIGLYLDTARFKAMRTVAQNAMREAATLRLQLKARIEVADE